MYIIGKMVLNILLISIDTHVMRISLEIVSNLPNVMYFVADILKAITFFS